MPLTGTEAAGCKEGGGYVLYANDHGKSDESGNLYFLNLYLRNPELAYPLDLGETGGMRGMISRDPCADRS